MQKYFIDHELQLHQSFIIDAMDHHHMKKVMRNKNGDHIVCIDTSHIQYLCIIEDILQGMIQPVEKLDIHNNKITELDLSNVCQNYLYKLLCDKDVKIIGQKKWVRIEEKYIKNNVIHYSFDLGGDDLLFNVSDGTYPVGKNKEDVSNLYKLFSKMDKNFQWVAYDSSRYWELGWDKKTGRLISVN